MSRRIGTRRQRRLRKLAFWSLVAGLLLYALFGGDHRPHHLALLWLEERETEDTIERLRIERESLRTRLGRVQEDRLMLEKLAREKGMIRPGDMVYRIVRVPPDLRRAVAESLAVEEARRSEIEAEMGDSLGDDEAEPDELTRPGAADTL